MTSTSKTVKTPIKVLEDLCVKNRYSPPIYSLKNQVMVDSSRYLFHFEVIAADLTAMGNGLSKQIARHNAALKMLNILEERGIYDPKEIPVEKLAIESPLTATLKSRPGEFIRPLRLICAIFNLGLPEFEKKSEFGHSQDKHFVFECKLAKINVTVEGIGYNMKNGKQMSAKAMLEKLAFILPEAKDTIYKVLEKNSEPPEVKPEIVEKCKEIFDNVSARTESSIEYCKVFKRYMQQNGKTVEEFVGDLKEQTEDSLKRLLGKLGLTYTWQALPTVSSDVYMACLDLSTDTPFTIIQISDISFDDAKHKTLKQAFEIMNIWMRL